MNDDPARPLQRTYQFTDADLAKLNAMVERLLTPPYEGPTSKRPEEGEAPT